MNDFENKLNNILVETFNNIFKYEESSLKTISSVPITITEAHLMEAIGKRNGITISEIAAAMDVKMPTVTVAIKKLMSKNLVTKETDETDSRRVMISLTALGRQLDRAHAFFHRKMVRNISEGFSENEKEALLSASEKLNIFFKNRVIS